MTQKLNFKNVTYKRIAKKGARISSMESRSSHHCCRQDNAVEGIQEAGMELSRFFDRLQNPEVAALLVRAIRCRNKRGVEALLSPDCEVVSFFMQNRMSCVRIKCTFGNCCDVVITFDICVSQGQCRIM